MQLSRSLHVTVRRDNVMEVHVKTRLLAFLCVSLLVVLAGAVPAQAAVPDKLHIQLWPETATDVFFLESATYAQGTPLPISVKMAIPKGARVVWVGEILGGPPANDIESKYRVNPKKDYDEITFTLRKSREAQVEAGWRGVTSKGNQNLVTLRWVQRYPAGAVDFGFKGPTPDSVVKMTPAWRSTNTSRDNLRFYVTAPMKLPVGKKVELKISYTGQPSRQGSQGQQGQSTGQSGGSSDKGLIVFLALIAGGAVALTIFAKTRKSDE